jgi:hypothetical protein
LIALSDAPESLTPDEAKHARTVLNASGFLFQLSVEHTIRSHYRGKSIHGSGSCWVLGREYPWSDENGRGYIDLLALKSDRIMVVFECKRTRDATWVFPIEAAKAKDESPYRLQWAERGEDDSTAAWIRDTRGGPETVVAEFCAVRGAGEGHAPMLETLCGTLLRSVEAAALEILQIEHGLPSGMFFLPTIVTNAKLVTCTVDPSTITMDGRTDSPDVKEIPFVRFHKSLTAKVSGSEAYADLQGMIDDRQRTVMVVNANHIVSFLTQLRLYGNW